MPYTGGGNPLPTTLGCRWCDYETTRSLSNAVATAKLLAHAQEAHPAEYKAAVSRPQTASAEHPQ